MSPMHIYWIVGKKKYRRNNTLRPTWPATGTPATTSLQRFMNNKEAIGPVNGNYEELEVCLVKILKLN